MTASPPPVSPGRPPPRLVFLTFPLLVSLLWQAISLLTLPFSGSAVNESLAEFNRLTGMNLPPLTPEQINVVLWLSFAISSGLILWLYNTRRALLEGKRWGHTSALVIAVLSLFLVPIGTLMGIVMLVGAFDRDVQRFASR